jgi:hypothetical protein
LKHAFLGGHIGIRAYGTQRTPFGYPVAKFYEHFIGVFNALVHLPCPTWRLFCRELRPVPMDVFLYRERDGRLVDDCAGLAMRQYTKVRAL